MRANKRFNCYLVCCRHACMGSDTHFGSVYRSPPPTGQVHESVMWFLWQILIFCGSIFGIVTYAKSSLGEIEL